MDKRFVLISPSYQYQNKSLKWVAKSITVAPPLGLLYVAEAAKSVGWSVEIIDSEMEEFSLETIINKAISAAPDLVGITVTTPFLQSAIQISTGIKKGADIPVVIGGAHPTAKGAETLLDCFDFAVQGEGDEAVKHFLNAFEGKGEYSAVSGLIYRENGEILANPSEQLKTLDKLAVPERGLLNLGKYVSRVPKNGKKRYTSIMATRGCPYECVFCAVQTMYGRTLRFRPVDEVIEEINICLERYGITHFHFVDDTLTVNKIYVRKLCRAIHENHLDITWEGWTRADCINEELLTLMMDAGFVRVSFGVETGNPEVMKILKKDMNHGHINAAFGLTNKLGLEARCSVMIGNPGETRKTLWDTINFIRNNDNIKYSTLSIATPYPGTELAEMAKEGRHGLKLNINDETKFLRYFSPTMQMNDLSMTHLKIMQIVGLIWMHMTPVKIVGSIKRFGFFRIGLTAVMTSLLFLKMIVVDTVVNSLKRRLA
ncbi:hypothetical protein UR09_05275 [Candidatus Nitromaritima sp. SCGC AAA799-A02]|nr:hypothetical protein UR09_05275 [Candidatus Nitromaritima sp. SCGC AAA799-A02]